MDEVIIDVTCVRIWNEIERAVLLYDTEWSVCITDSVLPKIDVMIR